LSILPALPFVSCSCFAYFATVYVVYHSVQTLDTKTWYSKCAAVVLVDLGSSSAKMRARCPRSQ